MSHQMLLDRILKLRYECNVSQAFLPRNRFAMAGESIRYCEGSNLCLLSDLHNDCVKAILGSIR